MEDLSISDYAARRSLSSISTKRSKSTARLLNAPPVVEKLWTSVLCEIEANFCVETRYGKIFTAGNEGKHFFPKAFNRDIAFSGILGLNALYPEQMLQSIKIIRRIRLDIGWKCPNDRVITGIPGVEIEDMSNHDFTAKYEKSSPIYKTDDVVWLWCAGDVIQRLGNRIGDLKWMYEMGKRSFKELYDLFYDSTDGLYFGQPTFIDVGATGFPDSFGKSSDDARNMSIWIKSTSTNCLYYKAFLVMAQTAELLGVGCEADAYKKRAADIKAAILRNLRFEDGTFCYFMHRDGHLENRREVFATALPVLTEIVTGDDAVKAVQGYPFSAVGAPLIYPFYDRNDFYHNNSSWPFASTYLSWAIEKATGVSHATENLAAIFSAVMDGVLYEVIDMRTNTPTRCPKQLWSEAAVINVCARLGYINL